MKSHYCAVATFPTILHRPTDIVLSAGLIGGGMFYPDWITIVNPWLAFAGGVIGLFIGSVRVYEILKQYFFTKKQ